MLFVPKHFDSAHRCHANILLLAPQKQVVCRLPHDWRFGWPVWWTLGQPVEKRWGWNRAIPTTNIARKYLRFIFLNLFWTIWCLCGTSCAAVKNWALNCTYVIHRPCLTSIYWRTSMKLSNMLLYPWAHTVHLQHHTPVSVLTRLYIIYCCLTFTRLWILTSVMVIFWLFEAYHCWKPWPVIPGDLPVVGCHVLLPQ